MTGLAPFTLDVFEQALHAYANAHMASYITPATVFYLFSTQHEDVQDLLRRHNINPSRSGLR